MIITTVYYTPKPMLIIKAATLVSGFGLRGCMKKKKRDSFMDREIATIPGAPPRSQHEGCGV